MAFIVLFVEILINAKLAMVLAGRMLVWEKYMIIMELVLEKFPAQIVAMGVLKEMEFALSVNKDERNYYF